jgi:hypothetical protein
MVARVAHTAVPVISVHADVVAASVVGLALIVEQDSTAWLTGFTYKHGEYHIDGVARCLRP